MPKSKKIFAAIFAGILLMGIFLRTYKLHDWLKFGPDQARDAILLEGVVNNQDSMSLLGPVAGGTNFHLGPAFYYFGYAAAKIFGSYPDKLAYPDVLFSILTIPLLFFFLRKYFNGKISLALIFLASISYFLIINSRFASNPNSTPFFVLLFLFSILQMTEKKESRMWPVVLGISAGVGVQLHTFLIFIMPMVLLIVFARLLWKKEIKWKKIRVIILFFLLVNAPQILSEIRSNGANTREFFFSTNSKSKSFGAVARDIQTNISCQINANVNIVFAVAKNEECRDFLRLNKNLKIDKKIPNQGLARSFILFEFLFGLVFSIGGYILLWKSVKKEEDVLKKNFIQIVLLYNSVSFLILIPVASEISLRYFTILFFIPFVLLGLWIKFLADKIKINKIILILLILAFPLFSNMIGVYKSARILQASQANDSENSILGEMEKIAEYVILNTKPKDIIYLTGERTYEYRFFRPLKYLLERKDRIFLEAENAQKINSNDSIFYIGKNNQSIREKLDEYQILDFKEFNKVIIFKVKKI